MSKAQEASPRFVTAVGRGHTGKSVLLRWAVERALDAGRDVVIADGDGTNCSLAARFGVERVTQPPSTKADDMFKWVCGLVDQQIEDRRTVYLDLGGGDTTLATWAREMDPLPLFLENGIAPVMLYLLSSDLDDLIPVLHMETVMQAPQVALVFNEGMIPPDRGVVAAFGATEAKLATAPFAAVMARAKMVNLPRLRIMQEVERKVALTPTGAFMVRRWEREVATELAEIADWIV